jgi:hypothetical protein
MATRELANLPITLVGASLLAMAVCQLTMFLLVYISVSAVTAACGFALTATHFFSNAKKSKQKRLAPASGPSLGLGVPSLRHPSGDIASGLLRCTSSRCVRLRRTALRAHSPDECLHSACRRGGWIKSKSQSKIKSARRANARPCGLVGLMGSYKGISSWSASSVGPFHHYDALRRCLQLRQNPPACVPWLGSLTFAHRCPFSDRV